MTGDDAGRQGTTTDGRNVVTLQREKKTASPPPPRLGEGARWGQGMEAIMRLNENSKNSEKFG